MWNKIIYELSRFEGLVFLFLIPCCIVGAIGWKQFPRALKLIVVFVWFDLCTEIILRVLAHAFKDNNPGLPFYAIGQMVLWSLFYREILPRRSVFVRYFKPITGVILLLIVLNSVFIQPLHTFCSYSITLVQIMIILYGIAFAFRFLEEANLDENLLEQQSFRYINSAVLLYYCGTLFVFMFGQFLTSDLTAQRDFYFLWRANILLNMILHIVILIILCKTIFSPRILQN